MNANTFSDLLSAYALGALSDEDRAAVESYLATSPEAQTELRDYQSMLAGLALLVPRHEAPARLTDDFRRRLATYEAGSGHAGSTPSSSTAPATSAPAKVPSPAAMRPTLVTPALDWSRRANSRRLVFALVAAFAIAFGVLAVWRIRLNNSNPDQGQIQSILGSSQAMVTSLNPAANAQGTVSFVTTPNNTKAVLVADLPTLPSGKQYQLWLIKDKTMDSAGVFDFDPSSAKQLLLTLPGPASNYAAVGLTVEPTGGSPAPTTSPIFVGNLD